MNLSQLDDLHGTALGLFQVSAGIFWHALPVAFLLAIMGIYAGGQISGDRFVSLFRRVLIAIALLVAFPQISQAFTDLESGLIDSFGGEESLTQVFAQVSQRAHDLKSAGALDWLRVGQIGLTLISTISFLILAIVRHFLDVLHIMTWNLLHIFGPLALLGCLFESWSHIPKGIFTGMLELSLWKPTWVILGRLLLAGGFGETPTDPSQWFDTAVMNFSVAALMATTPILVHGFLSGTIASIGGATIGSALSGAGGFLANAPLKLASKGASLATSAVKGVGKPLVQRFTQRKPPAKQQSTSGPKNQSLPKPIQNNSKK
jgi:hypothetical protein